MTLFEQLEITIDKINNLGSATDIKALSENVLMVNPEECSSVIEVIKTNQDSIDENGKIEENDITEKYGANIIAKQQLFFLKTIPGFMNRLKDIIKNKLADTATRTALISIIAYLVCENDLIDDNEPGGIGYFDDGIIIYTIAKELLDLLKPVQITKEDLELAITYFSYGVPDNYNNDIQKQINKIWKNYHMLKSTPSNILEPIIDKLINDPNILNDIMKEYNIFNIKIPLVPEFQNKRNIKNISITSDKKLSWY